MLSSYTNHLHQYSRDLRLYLQGFLKILSLPGTSHQTIVSSNIHTRSFHLLRNSYVFRHLRDYPNTPSYSKYIHDLQFHSYSHNLSSISRVSPETDSIGSVSYSYLVIQTPVTDPPQDNLYQNSYFSSFLSVYTVSPYIPQVYELFHHIHPLQ